MNRRSALAALGTAAVTLGGYGTVRVGDYRPYEVDDAPPAGRPDERVVAAARKLYTHDHRAVTDVTVHPSDESGVAYASARHCRVHEHSRRRHLAAYTTFRIPSGSPGSTSGGLLARLHGSYAASGALPHTSVIHVSDGTVVADWDAPTPADPDESPSVDGTDTYRSAKPDGYPEFGEHVLPHTAPWRETTRSEMEGTTVEYTLAGPEAYARVVPLLSAVEVHRGSTLVARLDAETGLLRRLVDRRVVTKRVGDGDGGTTTRRIQYGRVTTFDRYGGATAPRPAGAPRAEPAGYLRELVADLSRY